MDLISNHPFWPIQNGLIQSYPKLRGSIDCDVIVVGAGITGALCAFHLVKAGFDVVVVDKRDVAGGSTSASTSLIQYELDTPLTELRERYGKDRSERIYQSCYRSVETLRSLCAEIDDQSGFTRKASFYYASRPRDAKGLREEHRLRREAGIEVDLLDRTDIESRFPFTREAALLSKRAAEVDVYRLTHRLLRRAQGKGARIYDRTTLKVGETAPGRVTFHSDGGHVLRAKLAVFATGYEIVEMLGRRLVNLNSSFALISEPLENFPGWWDRCLIWETARPYLYLRSTVDGRILVGGEDARYRNPVVRDAAIPKKAARLEKRFRSLFPDIPLDPAYAWAGTFGETDDGLPYIGTRPDWPGCFFALGFGGNGIVYSLIAAEILTEAMQGKTHPDADLFPFDR
jgi:glycine/D-amino acid oxidase-like deaminating enzyme